MNDSDNLVGKKSAVTNTDYHDNPISGDDKESQEDLGTQKNNSSANEGSPQGKSSERNENKKSKNNKGPDVIAILKTNICRTICRSDWEILTLQSELKIMSKPFQ